MTYFNARMKVFETLAASLALRGRKRPGFKPVVILSFSHWGWISWVAPAFRPKKSPQALPPLY